MVDDYGKERASVDYPGNSRRYLGADSPCHSAKGYRRIALRTGLFRNTVRKYPSAAKAGGIAMDGPSPVMISSVARRPSDSLDRVRRRPPTRTC